MSKDNPIDVEPVRANQQRAPQPSLQSVVRQDISSLAAAMTTQQLKQAIEKQQKMRDLVKKYVQDNLVDGVDYGKIHIKKDCADKYNCTNTWHYSKNVLFKPGQEKIFSLMSLTSELVPDTETLDMLGNKGEVAAYVCRVYRGGVQIAEGRGAAKIGDNSRDVNSTIKIAQKRARVDACLTLGFSEYFTQDLESGGTGDASEDDLASPQQINYLQDLAKKLGRKITGDMDNLTKAKATALIRQLVEQAEEKGLIENNQAPELVVVDDDFKNQVSADLLALKLNTTDEMRLIKEATHKVKISKTFTDHEWRALREAIDNYNKPAPKKTEAAKENDKNSN